MARRLVVVVSTSIHIETPRGSSTEPVNTPGNRGGVGARWWMPSPSSLSSLCQKSEQDDNCASSWKAQAALEIKNGKKLTRQR